MLGTYYCINLELLCLKLFKIKENSSVTYHLNANYIVRKKTKILETTIFIY